jgi:uncharacterized protein YjgD (DUF1641 family)
MSTAVRTLIIRIDQTGDAKQGVDGLIQKFGGLGSIAAGAATAGIAMAGAAIVGLGAGLVSSVQAASEAQQVQAQLNAVLESTGGAAGVTADMANQLASSLQAVTMFEDDAILSGENMLLTFTNIGSDVFPMATQTMLDMSQALGQDVTQSAMQLGKALNDPVQGVTALQRVGVQLTEEQKASVEGFMAVNDIASAQKIILEELNREFGGSAVAAGQTLPGQMEILKNTFGDIKETIGGAFLPVIQEVASLFLAGLNSPEVQGALTALTTFLKDSLIPAISTLVAWIRDQVIPRFREFFRQVGEVGRPIMIAINDAINRVAEAFGVTGGNVKLLDVVFKALDITLKAVVLGIRIITPVIVGLADAVGDIAATIGWVIDRWKEFRDLLSQGLNIPSWLIPGSPTPFELGLRGIGNAMNDLKGLDFPVVGPGAGGGIAGAVGGQVVNVYLNYSPAVSLADRYEAEQKLAPYIRAALRGVA